MIDITKNYQDVKIYGFAIANFNHTKFSFPLYCERCTPPTHLSHFQEKTHKLITSLAL